MAGPVGLPRLSPGPATLPVRPKPALLPNATLIERDDLTPDVARMVVRPDGPIPSFAAGQYFSLGLTIDDRPILRPYSTASAPGALAGLEFLVRRVRGGTFTPKLWSLGPGDRLWIGPPKGLFLLKPGDRRTHLLVSAGTGIAPFIAMASQLLGRIDPPQVVMAHGVSYEAELAYRDRLEALAASRPSFVYSPAVSRPDAPENDRWHGRTGRVERTLPGLWTELGLEAVTTVAYLCGNPDMVAAARRTLLELGLPADAIYHENYWAVATT
jgi:ferredoxin-NADP reductase